MQKGCLSLVSTGHFPCLREPCAREEVIITHIIAAREEVIIIHIIATGTYLLLQTYQKRLATDVRVLSLNTFQI